VSTLLHTASFQRPRANCLWECSIISTDSQTAWERPGRLGQSHRDRWQHIAAADNPAVPRRVSGGWFVPHRISKPFSEGYAAGETEARGVRGLQRALCGGRPHLLLPALGSYYHTVPPDLLRVTPANLTSSVGENLTRTLHRCPGPSAPAEGSASKTQGLVFNSWSSF